MIKVLLVEIRRAAGSADWLRLWSEGSPSPKQENTIRLLPDERKGEMAYTEGDHPKRWHRGGLEEWGEQKWNGIRVPQPTSHLIASRSGEPSARWHWEYCSATSGCCAVGG
jgi:hypothetical protein